MYKQAGPEIIHLIHHPVAALRFVAPLVEALEDEERAAELWVQTVPALETFYELIPCTKRRAKFNLQPNILSSLLGAVSLWKDFRRLRPKCIQAHSTRSAFLPLLAAHLAGIPHRIYHNHGVPYLGYHGLLRFALKMLERMNVVLSTETLTVSHAMRDAMLRDRIVDAAKCNVLAAGSACGLDVTSFALCDDVIQKPKFKEALGINPNDFVVLFVGRPHARKGFDLTLRSWVKSSAARSDMKLLLLGCTEKDVQLVLGGDIPASIIPKGYIEDLRLYYSAADVVVLPSEHEGFGYALLEGAACYCSLIASDIPGPDAIVQHGFNGFLVPVNDEEALADSIEKLYQDRDLQIRFARNARLTAKKFDRQIVMAAYIDFINQKLSSNRTTQ